MEQPCTLCEKNQPFMTQVDAFLKTMNDMKQKPNQKRTTALDDKQQQHHAKRLKTEQGLVEEKHTVNPSIEKKANPNVNKMKKQHPTGKARKPSRKSTDNDFITKMLDNLWFDIFSEEKPSTSQHKKGMKPSSKIQNSKQCPN